MMPWIETLNVLSAHSNGGAPSYYDQVREAIFLVTPPPAATNTSPLKWVKSASGAWLVASFSHYSKRIKHTVIIFVAKI